MQYFIKLLLLFFFIGLSSLQSFSKDKFASAHSIALDGIIENGKILSYSSYESTIKSEIHNQLRYTIGQLNGEDSVADLNRTEIEIVSISARDSGLHEIHYKAKLFIAWEKKEILPELYTLILPARGDYQGLQEFFRNYAEDSEQRKLCLSYSAHDYQFNFWYFYRPYSFRCPLNNPQNDKTDLVVRIPMSLKLSNENTVGKYPEYHKVWEDNKLVATMIFGKNETDGGEFDVGVEAYNDMYKQIISSFGRPTTSNINLLPNQVPGLKNPEVHLIYEIDDKTLDFHIYLVKSIRNVDSNFRQKYNQRTLVSDFISYAGHSGLGANIRALADMGKFQAGQYQIFLINGCDTFAYVDDSLRDAHHLVNPNFGKDKFVDVITNAMPAYFIMNAHSNMTVLTALYQQEKTYTQMLQDFDYAQKAVVTGEQDNNYPEDF